MFYSSFLNKSVYSPLLVIITCYKPSYEKLSSQLDLPSFWTSLCFEFLDAASRFSLLDNDGSGDVDSQDGYDSRGVKSLG